jgi:hypothetical protein
LQNNIKNDLQNLFSGKGEVRFGATIQAVTHYLEKSSSSSPKVEDTKLIKKQEAEKLEVFISGNDLWKNVDFTKYVSEGAEQKVYLLDSIHVLKLNDAIYYPTWRDYFLNLLMHNYFFPDTAYELIGFTKQDEILHAIVEQAYVTLTEQTDLEQVKSFLLHNGFTNTRNNDYFNADLGIILEDLHDENVLTRNGILYFIDTVFYLTEKFNQERNNR